MNMLFWIVAPVVMWAGAVLAQTNSAPPAWTVDARWYYIVVPRFHNGDAENDPQGALPWSAEWPTDEQGTATVRQAQELDERQYGGDLQGIIRRLSYLKSLGVNVLCLSPVFDGAIAGRSRDVDLRHVDPLVAVKGSYGETNEEGSEPATWKWSSSDRLFLEFIQRAHAEGFRIVIGGVLGSTSAPLDEMETYVAAVIRRWMDPNADGDPSDGVDGWVHSLEGSPLGVPTGPPKAARRRVYEQVKKTNPNAVMIATGPFAAKQVSDGLYDLAADSNVAAPIQRFFRPGNSSPGAAFLAEFEGLVAGVTEERRTASLIMLSGLESPRLLTQYSPQQPARANPESPAPSPVSSEQACDHWRLATVFQHLAFGSPVTYYGDEVGLHGGAGPFSRPPMRWHDLSAAPQARADRDDFRKLVEWLHRTRSKYAPLRTGAFRALVHDDQRKLLAFARSLPGDEIIVVMNCGDAKQEVELPAGRTGQLVALLSPQIKPPPPRPVDEKRPRPRLDAAKATRLQVGGSRQFVNPEGKVSLWVGAKSVRVIIVKD